LPVACSLFLAPPPALAQEPSYDSVVTGSRTESKLADAPIATEVITRTDIERLGARDAAEVLSGVPGVQVDRSFAGSSISLQGLDPQYVLILIDGQRVIGRIEGVIDLTRLPVDDIERIEIVRGPSSALWGADALGGVVNIITRRSRRKWEADGRLSYGSLNATDAVVGAGMKRERGSLRVTGGYHRRDAWDLDPETPGTTGNGFEEFDFAARGDVRADKRLKLRASADYLQRRMTGVDEAAGGAIFDRVNLTQTASAQVTPEITFAFPGKLRLTAYYTWFRDQFRNDQRNSDALDQYQDTREQLGRIETQYDHVLPRGHFLSVGIEGQLEHLQSDRLEGGSSTRGRGAAYIQDQWSLSAGPVRMALVPAVRVDIDSQFGTAVSPKLALRADPHPKITFRVSYGRGFRPPTFKELLLRFANTSANYVVEGNPALQPETSNGVNAAIELRPVTGLWFSVNYFYNGLSNLIQASTVEEGAGGMIRFQYVNIASAWTQGLESSMRIGPFRGVSLDLGATLTLSEDEVLHRPLEGRPVIRGNFLLSMVPPRWGTEVTLRGSVFGSRPIYIDGDTVYTEPYLMLDARIGQTIKKYVTLFVSGQNLLGAGDARFPFVPPRQFFGGVIGRY
jgi:outer membrane receptor for ferrienterochelin and colicins